MEPGVSLAAPHELLAALKLLFPQSAELAHGLAANNREPIGVFVSRDGVGRVRGAAMVQALPGAIGVAWRPHAQSVAEGDELVRAACDWLIKRKIRVCQAFAATAELPAMAPLERNGFRHITQLLSMQCCVSSAQPACTLAVEAVAPGLPPLFRNVLLSTHAGTLDCPELDGSRTAEELVAGYGDPAATEWHLALDAGVPVGVVMLAPGPELGALELAYMAVVPAARGRGIGHELMMHALAEAIRKGATRLTLSVDARNEPALRLYLRNGFAESDRREVFLAHFF